MALPAVMPPSQTNPAARSEFLMPARGAEKPALYVARGNASIVSPKAPPVFPTGARFGFIATHKLGVN
jgi:hypothetical protein